MRRVLLILMIALLPVRALAGDWMLLSMATGAMTQGDSMAMPDCEMHLSQAGGLGSGEDPASPSSDSQCNSCSLCYPLAQLTPFEHALPFSVPAARPAFDDRDFLSAAVKRSLRPPSL